jgi:3-methyladenine DNA glycosylase/8-oxoguanine DNA glycosylase
MAHGSAATSRAVRHLRLADPVLAEIIRRVGPCRFETRNSGTHFEALARAIVYQQLSGSAAGTIHGRVAETLGGITPEAVLGTPDAPLRAAGLSRQKIAYLRDLSERVHGGELDLRRIHELPDDDVVAAVCSVKGIGRWTAHMFLMFRLGRLDVLPELDLGVRKAVQRAYRMRKLPSTERLTKLGSRWAPYRTIAAWYLWRSLEV